MVRIKPLTLLLQSKKKKGPSRVSVPTIIVYYLLVGVLVLLLVATYRLWSKRSNEPNGMDLSNFEGVDVSLDSKKYDLPVYAPKGTFQGDAFSSCDKNYVIQGGNSEDLGSAED